MGLSAHELLLILRARDEASRVVRGFAGTFGELSAAEKMAATRSLALGVALTTAGVGVTALGGAAVYLFKQAADAAAEYQKQVGLTYTQAEGVGTSLAEIAQIGKDVGKSVGAPFEQMQEGLYNIFSSIDVNVPQAKTLLEAFAKAAVAGGSDINTVSTATIGIMNAYKIPVENVNDVLDFQFQLVRKGVGTFDQFASTIGRAIPSTVRAGQSYQTLGGMLAYLTRNGLSTAMAAASAARAMDAFSHPKTIERLAEMGIETKDAAGNFRDFGAVMADLQKELSGLTAPERAAALQALFKGSGGTIQARRFFDLVLQSEDQVKSFTGFIEDMNTAQGANSDAYKVMADTYATKTQLMKNKFEVARIEIGEHVLPVMMKLVEWLTRLVDWWNNLDPVLKKNIVQWGMLTAALLLVVGVGMVLVGVFTMLKAAVILAGSTMSKFFLTSGLVGLAILALVAGLYLLITHWDDVKKAAGVVADWFSEHVWPAIKSFADWFEKTFGPLIGKVADWIVEQWQKIVKFAKDNWDNLKDIFRVGWDVIKTVFKLAIGAILFLWESFGESIIRIITIAWDTISAVIGGAIDIILGVLQVFISLFTGDWKGLWEGIKMILSGALDIVVAILKGAWDLFWEIITGIGGQILEWLGKLGGWILDAVLEFPGLLGTAGMDLLQGLWDGIVWIWDNHIVPFFTGMPGTIGGWFVGAGIWLLEVGKAIIQGLWDGITWLWKTVVDWFLSLPGRIARFFRDAVTWLYEAGRDLIVGLVEGMIDFIDETLKPFGFEFKEGLKRLFGIKSPAKEMIPIGRQIVLGLMKGIMDEDPEGMIKSVFGSIPNALKALIDNGDIAIPDLTPKAIEALLGAGFGDILGGFGALFGGAGGAGAGVAIGGSLAQWVAQAMALTGAPGNWLGPLMGLAMHESGGNPNAINLWDINAARGHPSQGLFQTIPSTFNAYKLFGSINDPVANAVAAIRYIMSRYGSIFNIPSYRGGNSFVGGYEKGSPWIPYNQYAYLHRGEAVLTAEENKARKNQPMVQNFYVTTQEIDPRRHAADLGWELWKGI